MSREILESMLAHAEKHDLGKDDPVSLRHRKNARTLRVLLILRRGTVCSNVTDQIRVFAERGDVNGVRMLCTALKQMPLTGRQAVGLNGIGVRCENDEIAGVLASTAAHFIH